MPGEEHHYVDITTAEAANYSLTGTVLFAYYILIDKICQ